MPAPCRLLPALALAAALVSCGGSSDGTSTRTTGARATHVAPSPSPRDVDPALADLVDTARSDLADHLGVSEDEIRVVSAQTVTWGDTSLGCPQPGRRYAQVVTDGTRIVLEHQDATYAYHSGGDRRRPFLCEDPTQPVGARSSLPHPDDRITDPAY